MLKLHDYIFDENDDVVANSILCMTSLIPNFSYHKTLYDGKILKKLGEVAGKSENQICKIQALTLLRKLIDFGEEHNIEVLNELSLPPTIDNLTIPKKEDLSTQTPYRDILYNTLKIFAFLLDDFACLEEEKLIKSMLILLQGNQIDNDPKIEKLVIQIIKILWDQSQELMLQYIDNKEIIQALINRYLS